MKCENIKRQFALEERERLLDLIGKLDVLIEGSGDEVDSDAIMGQLEIQFSFAQSADWLRVRIEKELPSVKSRLDDLVRALDSEFPWIDETCDFQQARERAVKRLFAHEVTKLFMDTSLVLYALGWNGPATIELHSILERNALERLIGLVLLSDRQEIGFKVFGRRTLPELASMLQDCGVLDREDVKFAQKLNSLRSGLAHKNVTAVANAVLSGQELLVADIDWRMSNIDYIPFAVGAVHLFMKIEGFEQMLWESVGEEGNGTAV